MKIIRSIYKNLLKLIRTTHVESNDKKSIEKAEDNETTFFWDREGLWKPLDRSDEVGRYWYIAVQDQEEYVEQNKRDLEELEQGDDELRIICQEFLDESIKDLKKLREFYDNTIRSSERFKHDKILMKQISDDWYDFNKSLYTDAKRDFLYHRFKPPHRSIEERKLRKLRLDKGKIQRDEIMRRMRMLLSE